MSHISETSNNLNNSVYGHRKQTCNNFNQLIENNFEIISK